MYPSEYFRRLEEMGAVVYEYLLKVHRDVPFTFRDHFELWLLDARHRPLALVHSVLTETDTETDPPLDWRAGIAAQTQFCSNAFTLEHPPSAYLTRHINGLIGRTPAQWFVRTDDGAGLGLRVVGNAQSLKGRVLETELFPPFYLATDGMDVAHLQLVQDYHAWRRDAAVAASRHRDTRNDGSTCTPLSGCDRKTSQTVSASGRSCAIAGSAS